MKPVGAKRHGRKCGCGPCLKVQLAWYQERVRKMGDEAPPSPEHTVPVKPHWRKVKNHLGWNPALRKLVDEIVYGYSRGRRRAG